MLYKSGAEAAVMVLVVRYFVEDGKAEQMEVVVELLLQ